MKWLNNLSIKYKLLLGFSLVVAFTTPIAFIGVYGTWRIQQSFRELINLSFPRMQALTEMKNVALQIEMVASNCQINIEAGQSSKAQNCKNQLRVYREHMDNWSKQYQQHLSSNLYSTIDTKKLNTLQDQIILAALGMLQAKEKQSASQLITSQQQLKQAENNITDYINNAVKLESNNLEQAQAGARAHIYTTF